MGYCRQVMMVSLTDSSPFKLTMRRYLMIAASLGLLAVALGAFGAHGLKAQLSVQSLATWQTAVFYHLVHALLAAAVSLQAPAPWLKRSAACLLAGCLLFSGSLYALALGGPSWLGPVTPLGGLSFMLGWLCLLLHAVRQPHASH